MVGVGCTVKEEEPASHFVVTQLNPDGSLDRGFDADATAVADFGGEEEANAAALQPDGRIVGAGNNKPADSGPRLAVARLNPDGRLGPTFDPGGPDGDGRKHLPLLPGRGKLTTALPSG